MGERGVGWRCKRRKKRKADEHLKKKLLVKWSKEPRGEEQWNIVASSCVELSVLMRWLMSGGGGRWIIGYEKAAAPADAILGPAAVVAAVVVVGVATSLTPSGVPCHLALFKPGASFQCSFTFIIRLVSIGFNWFRFGDTAATLPNFHHAFFHEDSSSSSSEFIYHSNINYRYWSLTKPIVN